jgi:TolB-like protein/uncharacterized protein (DUF2267 family)
VQASQGSIALASPFSASWIWWLAGWTGRFFPSGAPGVASRLSPFLSELKRRRVYHVAAAYAVVGAVLGGAANDFLPGLGAPPWAVSFILVLILVGFPIALVLAWAYEVRPEEPRESRSTDPARGSPPSDVSAETPGRRTGPTKGLDPCTRGTAEGSAGEPSVGARKSIAVLPFANRSGLEADLHFTDGIHDQIISQLHKVGSLSVRGRTSVEVYRNTPKNLRAIGEELNARYLMEGGVQRAGERVRIIVQLIDARNDEHLWSEEFDRSLSTENLFQVQSEIALGVVSELRAVLTPEERVRIKTRPTESLEAYEAFLRGRQHMARQTTEGILQAMREFEKAIGADPGYAQAHAALANAYLRTVTLHEALGPSESEVNLRRAGEAARRALELDPTVSEAHVVLAIRALQWDWDWGTARDMLLRALDLNPSDALAHATYALHLCYKERRFREGQEMALRARELDPFDPFMTSYWIWTLWAGGDFSRVLEEARKAAEVWPEKPFTHYWVGIGLMWTGHPEGAVAELERAVQLGGRGTFFLSLLGGAHALAGNQKEARGLLNELEQRDEKGAAVGRWIASVYAALGEGDNAMGWLARAMEEHDPALFHALTDPFFEKYREDPRFLTLMSRIGLETARE